MTANWFEGTIKYVAIDDCGREVKKADTYLLDAMSYTEAEARLMKAVIKGDYYISSLKKSNITELVLSNNETDDRWYKAKIAIIDADEVNGKEKSSYQYYLVAAASINRALENLEKSLSTFVVPYEICSLADTRILDIFPYLTDDTADKNSDPAGN